MLVLTRKRNSSIQIGPHVTVTIFDIRGGNVKVGVEAPRSTRIWRSELQPIDEASAEDAGQNGWKSLEVLLVEDDPGHADLICRALSGCKSVDSVDVAIATTGEIAMEALEMDQCTERGPLRFDLILLDLNLPRVSGLDLLHNIRADATLDLTPVVMLSCTDDDAAATSCLAAGANAFVRKSDDPESFRTSVSRIATFWGSECHIPRHSVCLPR